MKDRFLTILAFIFLTLASSVINAAQPPINPIDKLILEMNTATTLPHIEKLKKEVDDIHQSYRPLSEMPTEVFNSEMLFWQAYGKQLDKISIERRETLRKMIKAAKSIEELTRIKASLKEESRLYDHDIEKFFLPGIDREIKDLIQQKEHVQQMLREFDHLITQMRKASNLQDLSILHSRASGIAAQLDRINPFAERVDIAQNTFEIRKAEIAPKTERQPGAGTTGKGARTQEQQAAKDEFDSIVGKLIPQATNHEVLVHFARASALVPKITNDKNEIKRYLDQLGDAVSQRRRQLDEQRAGSTKNYADEIDASETREAFNNIPVRGPIYAYQILDVTPTASKEEIRSAYKKASLKLHPDRNKRPNANAAFRILNEAQEEMMANK